MELSTNDLQDIYYFILFLKSMQTEKHFRKIILLPHLFKFKVLKFSGIGNFLLYLRSINCKFFGKKPSSSFNYYKRMT